MGKCAKKEPGLYSISCADILVPALAYKIRLEKDTGWLSSRATQGVLIQDLPFCVPSLMILEQLVRYTLW